MPVTVSTEFKMHRPIEDDFSSLNKYETFRFRKQDKAKVSETKESNPTINPTGFSVQNYDRGRMMNSEQTEESDQYNNEEIIDSILETFKFTRERFEELNEDSTKFVKTYWATMNLKAKELYFHYSHLDPFLDSYLQFGADKCSVRNIQKFCHDLNIDYDDLVGEIEKFPMGMDTKFGDERTVFRGIF